MEVHHQKVWVKQWVKQQQFYAKRMNDDGAALQGEVALEGEALLVEEDHPWDEVVLVVEEVVVVLLQWVEEDLVVEEVRRHLVLELQASMAHDDC